MHENNLWTLFYRWTPNPEERMIPQGELPSNLKEVAMPQYYTTETSERRYRGDPPPALLVGVTEKTFGSKILGTFTTQFRANPTLNEILAFRADEFAKLGLYREAIAGKIGSNSKSRDYFKIVLLL